MARKSRRRSRGAAMIESLIVISVMILFFLGMVFFESIYTQKLRAMSIARGAIVAFGMNACQGTPLQYNQGQLNGATPGNTLRQGGALNINGLETPQIGLSNNGPVSYWLDKFQYSQEFTTGAEVMTQAGGTTRTNTGIFGFQTTPVSESFALCGDLSSQGNYPDVVQSITISIAFPFPFP